jgi:hypothetical protein
MPERQHAVMIEAVENHMPEVIIIDEIGTELEAQAARTIAERGVQLVGTAHGTSLENLMLNPTLSDLVGGIQSVTLSDEEARRRGTQKSVLERKAPPTFDIIVELLDRERVAVHRDVAETVDSLLRGEIIPPEIRTRRTDGTIHTEIAHIAPPAGRGGQQGGRGRDGGRRGGYDDRGQHGLPNAPRRQMPESPAMRSNRTLQPERLSGRATQAGTQPFGASTNGTTVYGSAAPAATAELEAMYDEVEPQPAPEEADLRVGPNPMSIAHAASPAKPLRVYPFGVSRNRLEQAVKTLRVPAALVRDMNDADIVMTLKNYYRKSPQALRAAESSGVPVFVLRSNTLSQIEQALANVFNVQVPRDPVTTAMEEAEDAINSVLQGDRPVDLTPQSSQIRKLQHQLAERYNLASVSRGKEPFRRVRIFRQD